MNLNENFEYMCAKRSCSLYDFNFKEDQSIRVLKREFMD